MKRSIEAGNVAATLRQRCGMNALVTNAAGMSSSSRKRSTPPPPYEREKAIKSYREKNKDARYVESTALNEYGVALEKEWICFASENCLAKMLLNSASRHLRIVHGISVAKEAKVERVYRLDNEVARRVKLGNLDWPVKTFYACDQSENLRHLGVMVQDMVHFDLPDEIQQHTFAYSTGKLGKFVAFEDLEKIVTHHRINLPMTSLVLIVLDLDETIVSLIDKKKIPDKENIRTHVEEKYPGIMIQSIEYNEDEQFYAIRPGFDVFKQYLMDNRHILDIVIFSHSYQSLAERIVKDILHLTVKAIYGRIPGQPPFAKSISHIPGACRYDRILIFDDDPANFQSPSPQIHRSLVQKYHWTLHSRDNNMFHMLSSLQMLIESLQD